MARRILVVPATHGAGTTAACLGLAAALRSRRVAVAFAKPFEQGQVHGADQSTELFRSTMALRPPQPIPASVLARGLASDSLLRTMSKAVALTAELDAANRVLVLEGLAPSAEQPAADRINVELAQAYDAEVLIVGSAENTSPEQLAERIASMALLYTVRGENRVLGAVVNRVPDEEQRAAYTRSVTERGQRVVACVTARPELTHRRVSDVVRELGLGVIREGEQDRRVASTIIVAQNAPGFLDWLVPDRLVIVPGDRHEVLMGAALAEAGGTRLAAVLLTGGIAPDPRVLDLCEAAAPSRLPILSSEDLTFETTQRVLELSAEVPGDDEDRATALMETFADAYDEAWVDALQKATRPQRVTPAAFRHRVLEHAGMGITRLAVTDGADPRVLRAVCRLEGSPYVHCSLVGDPAEIDEAVTAAGLDLPPQVRIVDPTRPGEAVESIVAETLGRTGLDLGPTDPFVVGLGLQAVGEVDGVVGGIDLPRATAMPTIDAFVGVRSDVRAVSASQVVELPDEVLLYADTALIGEPDADELACIAAQTAATAELFGLEPRISFVRPSSSSPRVEEQRQRIEDAMEMLRQRRPDLPTRGPVAYGTATRRRPDRTDGGENSTVLVFPEIASATATVRVAAGTVGARVHPPLMQGLARAVNQLGRKSTVSDVTEALIATAAQASALG